MPPQFHADQAQPDRAQPGYDTEPGTAAAGSGVSRRSLLRGAAGAGAVGLVAATGAGAAFAATRPAAAARPGGAARPGTLDAATEHAGGEPLVVYLRDLKTGEVEVFNGTSQVRVRSPKLVAQLMADLQTAQ